MRTPTTTASRRCFTTKSRACTLSTALQTGTRWTNRRSTPEATAAAGFGATALMSNHTECDNGFFKARTAANRKPGEANPFDAGAAAVARYFAVVRDCTTAARIRATGK